MNIMMLMRHRHVVAMLAILPGSMLAPGSVTAQNDAAGVPSTLWAAQTGLAAVTLSWSAVPGATGYRLQCASGDGEPQPIGRPASNATQWHLRITPSMLGAEQRCFLQVETRNGLSETVAFNPVTPAPNATRPESPASIATEQTAAQEITVTWTEVPGATAYFIARAAAPDGFRVICHLCPLTASYVDRDVTAGRTYSYAVSAVAPGGTSRRVASAPLVADAGFGLAAPDDDEEAAAGGGDEVSATSGAGGGHAATGGSATGGNPAAGGTPRAGGNPGAGGTSAGGSARVPGGISNPGGTGAGTTGGSTGSPPSGTAGSGGAGTSAGSTASSPRPCLLEYQRADNMWAALGRPDGNLGTERLTLQPGQKRVFVTDWKFEKQKNDGSNYYGSHARVVTNRGDGRVIVGVKGEVANERRGYGLPLQGLAAQIKGGRSLMLEPGARLEMKADLLEAMCSEKQ